MRTSAISNLHESTSTSSSLKLSNISPRKNDSALPRLKPVKSSKLNLKKLVITAENTLPSSSHNGLQEGTSPRSTNRLQPIQSAHLSPREHSVSKVMKTEPNRNETFDKTISLTIKDFGLISMSPRSDQEIARSPLSFQSPRRLLAISTQREIESTSLDESRILMSNFSKFNNYLASLKKSESRKSPLAKETFYYPEQLEMNKRFKRIERDMRSVDEKGLFNFRTMRDGKKEKIRLPIGSKTYMKIDCEGKVFPLHVKVETKLGTFQIFVSRTQERPDRQNCDYYFSQAYFEIDYPNPDKIKTLHFHVLGTGNMELGITMNFSDTHEAKNTNLAKSQLISSNKGIAATSRYEIFHENMTRDEERNLKEIVDEIRRERAQRMLGQSRDVVNDNLFLAADYPKIKKEQQAEFIQKRDFTLYKNREKRAHLTQRKKVRQVCDMMKPDVKRVVRSWKMQKDAENNQLLTVQKSWLVLAALCFLGKEIREKKRVVIAWRVITRIKEHAVCKIQRMVRMYLSRPLEIKGRIVKEEKSDESDESDESSESGVNQHHQDLVMLNMFNGINTAVLQWRHVQKQNAEKVLGAFFRDFSFVTNINKAAKDYSVRVTKIQRKWKQKTDVVNARVDIFLTCWNEYCGLLLAESKAKNKLLSAFSKIKEQQIREKGKKFVQKRMGSGTIQYVIDAFKTQHNSSRIGTSLMPSLTNDRLTVPVPKNQLRRGSKLARASLLQLSRGSITDIQNQPQSRFIPSLAELKDIFDAIIGEIQTEGNLK